MPVPSKVYVGSTAIGRIYRGASLIMDLTAAPPPVIPDTLFENPRDAEVIGGFTAGATNVTLTLPAYVPPDVGADDQTLIAYASLQDYQNWAQANVTVRYATAPLSLIEWERGNADGATSWSHALWLFKLPSPRLYATSGDVVLTYAGPAEGSCKLRLRVMSVRHWAGAHSDTRKARTPTSTATSLALPATTTAARAVRLLTGIAYNGNATNPNPAAGGTGHALLGAATDTEVGLATGVVRTTDPGGYTPSFGWTGGSQGAAVSCVMTATSDGA